MLWTSQQNLKSLTGAVVPPAIDFEALPFSSVQIIEFGNHYGAASSLALLFWNQVPVTLHTRFLYSGNGQSEFGKLRGQVVAHAAIPNRYSATLKFYGAIFKAVKGKDLIWISTGPEHSVVPDVLFLGVLMLFFRKRIVLTIRDANNWLTGYPRGFFSRVALRLRRMYLPYVQRLVFETRTQQELFFDHYPQLSPKSSSLPTMFSDGGLLWGFGEKTVQSVSAVPTLRIGLVGAVDPTRRDYSQLIRALKRVAQDLREPLELVILGNSEGPRAKETLRELREVAVVENAPGFLPQSEFIRMSRTCDVLLAPLMPGKSYGQTRGTGVFGDAMVTGIKVVIPSFVDPNEEFSRVSIRYEDEEGLSQIILEVSRSGRKLISPEVLSFYSSSSLQAPLFEKLNIAFEETS